jgi:hypothetical protein
LIQEDRMKTHLQISLGLLLISVTVVAVQEKAKLSASAESIAESKREAILAEIKKLPEHAWSGDYYAGDGLGVNTALLIAPDSGYLFEWRGCLGLYDRNYGMVTSTNGRIRLSFTFENVRKGFQGIAPELVPVAWGSRRYLVPADDVVGFCNHVNAGREPRNGSRGFYLLRRGDEKKKSTGLPKLPAEYTQYLLAKPIKAEIIAVGASTTRPSAVDWKFKDTPVTLDAGKNHGVRVGMELVVTKPRNTVESVRVVKVDETRVAGVHPSAVKHAVSQCK